MRKSNDTSLITGETGSRKNVVEHTSSLNDEFLDNKDRERYGLYGPIPQTKVVHDVGDIMLRSKSASNSDGDNSLEV